MDPTAVLTALADLTPSARGRDRALDVLADQAPVWLREPRWVPRGPVTERLAAIDVLHHRERLLRRGWLFVCGTTEPDGARRRVRLPLLSEPVRLKEHAHGYQVVPAGDPRLTPLVSDPDLANELESAEAIGTPYWLTLPSTREWLDRAATAAGLRISGVRPPPTDMPPLDLPSGRLEAVVGAALYVARDVYSGSLRDSLLSWANRNVSGTALTWLYGARAPDRPADDGPVHSPLLLSQAQAEVVRRARAEPVTVVSGPPGSGKSHAVVAAALDQVDRGASVLVATRSAAAAEALSTLLDRYPGPPPVRFGDAEDRAVADEIAGRPDRGPSARALQKALTAMSAAVERVRVVTAAIDATLLTERRVAALSEWEPSLPRLRAAAPRAFAPGVDLSEAERLLRRRAWPAWSRRAALRRLRALLGAGPRVPPAQLAAAVSAARASADAAALVAAGGTDLAAAWQELHAAEAALRETVGTVFHYRATWVGRWHRRTRRDVAALAETLRATRAQRRHRLAGMLGSSLVRALPLWVGTAADVEDLLPAVPKLFDLVIIDEAAHLEQPLAALLLTRARRALVVGDPRQLPLVPFVSDADVTAAMDRFGLDERVDVRRVSTFDLAAGVAPVTWLGEHYRSVPHLIGFAAERFYRGRLSIATRHPANESRTAIEVVRVSDVDEEVRVAVAQVRRLGGQRPGGIAVLSPFRAHADALAEALLAEFSAARLARWGVRVGTVHRWAARRARWWPRSAWPTATPRAGSGSRPTRTCSTC